MTEETGEAYVGPAKNLSQQRLQQRQKRMMGGGSGNMQTGMRGVSFVPSPTFAAGNCNDGMGGNMNRS